MDWFRLRHTIGLCMQQAATERAEYIRKHDLFHHMGRNCMVMFRKLPLYPKLISLGDNVWLASNVGFTTHDVIHRMVNNMQGERHWQEFIGCIDIGNNVFVGANTEILYNVRIDDNSIIGANSLVNKSLLGGGVFAGIPARYVCSLEEFMARREAYPAVDVRRGQGGLSEETLTACWERFRRERR